MYTNDEPATIPDGVSKLGRFVIIELSALDYGGNTVRTNPASASFVKIMTSTADMKTQIVQNKPVLTDDGVALGTPTVYQPSAWLDPLADQFQYGVYCCQGTAPNQVDLPYYYYMPSDLEPGEVYAMVVILPGQGMGYYNGTNPIGANPKVNVVADIQAIAWLQPEWTGTDEKVIVLAPQSRRTGAAAEATAVRGLMAEFMAANPVDPQRVYFSTVSYGSTTAWAMMQQNPGIFDAGLLTGGFAVSVAQANAIATARPLTPIYITHGTFDHLLNVATTGRVSRDRLRTAYLNTGLVDAAGAAALIPYQEYNTPAFINQVVPQVPGYAEPDNHAVVGPTYADTSKLTWLLYGYPPVWAPIEDQSVDENRTLTFTVSASDPEGKALTYSTGPLPAGASFNPETQEFTWTPDYTQAGVYPIVFYVSDGENVVSKGTTITVNDVLVTDQIAGLKATVAGLSINGGLKNAFTVKLDQVLKLLSNDNPSEAVQVLNGFIGQANDLRDEGKLTAAQAAELINAAQETILNIMQNN
jgi:predicted peptidase